jgi:retron-type reverse transcriptase
VIGSRVGWGRRWAKVVGAGKDTRRARVIAGISSMSERPISDRPRRLADWLNPTGAKKVHSLVDKVYKRKNLELAWIRVRSNGGSGGVDGQSLAEFEEVLDEQLDRLGRELCTDTYQPLPVRRHLIPKAGQPGKYRPLGIATI